MSCGVPYSAGVRGYLSRLSVYVAVDAVCPDQPSTFLRLFDRFRTVGRSSAVKAVTVTRIAKHEVQGWDGSGE